MPAGYSIGDLAREFGITTRTLRHYEEEGLLNPIREGTARVFNSRDRARLKLALRAKRLGFPLHEIRELFQLFDLTRSEPAQLGEFLAKLEKRRASLEQQQEDISVMLSEINFFAGQCHRLMGSASAKEGP